MAPNKTIAALQTKPVKSRCPKLLGIRVVLTLRRLLPVKQTFSAATPTGCKRFERGAGAVYKKRAGVFSRHHDDTMMRDENRVKKCKKYLILLNKLAGVVQWQNGSFPIFLPRSKTNLVNPPPEQEHGKAFAVARRNRFHFMAENCPKRGCSGDKLGASISGFGLCEGLGSRAEPDYPQSRLKPTGRGK
jgi:hypothetical protein